MPFSGIQGIGENFNGIQGINSQKKWRFDPDTDKVSAGNGTLTTVSVGVCAKKSTMYKF